MRTDNLTDVDIVSNNLSKFMQYCLEQRVFVLQILKSTVSITFSSLNASAFFMLYIFTIYI